MLNLFAKCPKVLLLGYNSQTIKLIRILNKKYNINPFLFADKRPKQLKSLLVRYIFVKQKLSHNMYYTEHAILDIAKSHPGESIILIPCSSHFANIINKNAETFEYEYILCDNKHVQDIISSPIF